MAKISLTADHLRDLARTGADVTLKHLRAEIIAIERTFPELQLRQGRRAVRRSLQEATTRTRTMSAEARKAVSARMKRYLGGATEGAGEGEVRTRRGAVLLRPREAVQLLGPVLHDNDLWSCVALLGASLLDHQEAPTIG